MLLMFHIIYQNLVDNVSRETYILIFDNPERENVSRETTTSRLFRKSISRIYTHL